MLVRTVPCLNGENGQQHQQRRQQYLAVPDRCSWWQRAPSYTCVLCTPPARPSSSLTAVGRFTYGADCCMIGDTTASYPSSTMQLILWLWVFSLSDIVCLHRPHLTSGIPFMYSCASIVTNNRAVLLSLLPRCSLFAVRFSPAEIMGQRHCILQVTRPERQDELSVSACLFVVLCCMQY